MKTSKGFTIIEIVVVIAIILVIFTISIANFPAIKLQFALLRTTYKFAQDLRTAQNLALSANQYSNPTGQCSKVAGYGIYIYTPQNQQYSMYADNNTSGNANNQYDSGDCFAQQIISTEPGVVIKKICNVVGSNVSIDFSPPDPTTTITTLAAGQTEVDVVFALSSDLTQTKTVAVNTAGLIEVENSLPSCN